MDQNTERVIFVIENYNDLKTQIEIKKKQEKSYKKLSKIDTTYSHIFFFLPRFSVKCNIESFKSKGDALIAQKGWKNLSLIMATHEDEIKKITIPEIQKRLTETNVLAKVKDWKKSTTRNYTAHEREMIQIIDKLDADKKSGKLREFEEYMAFKALLNLFEKNQPNALAKVVEKGSM